MNIFRRGNLAVIEPAQAPEPQAAPDTLASLLAERDKAAAELQRLSILDARVAEAERAIESAEDALRAFAAAEADSARRWAESVEGEAPEHDAAAHHSLMWGREEGERRLEIAKASRAAAEPAVRTALANLSEIQI